VGVSPTPLLVPVGEHGIPQLYPVCGPLIYAGKNTGAGNDFDFTDGNPNAAGGIEAGVLRGRVRSAVS
jgi:hypothetical protein